MFAWLEHPDNNWTPKSFQDLFSGIQKHISWSISNTGDFFEDIFDTWKGIIIETEEDYDFYKEISKVHNKLKMLELFWYITEIDTLDFTKALFKWDKGISFLLNKYKNNIIDFQIFTWLIENKNSPWAGNINWPKTTQQIITEYKKVQNRDKKIARNIEIEDFNSEMLKILEEYNIPYYIVANLIDKENCWWDPDRKSEYSSAYWLSQTTNDTWDFLSKKIKWKVDRNSPLDHIRIICANIMHIKKTKQCSYEEVYWYYNTWLNVKNISNRTLKSYIAWNTPIRNKIPLNKKDNVTPEIFWRSAIAYYTSKNYYQVDHFNLA